MPDADKCELTGAPGKYSVLMSSILGLLERFTTAFSYWFNWIAGVALVAMLALTVTDIIGIKVFNWPVPGAIEIVGFLGVLVIGFAIAYTQKLRGHIQVEFFVMHLPKRLRAGVNAFVSLLGIVLFAILSWRSFDYALSLQQAGEVSMTQNIPFYPFVHAIAFCCIPVCLVLVMEFIKSITETVKK